MAAANAPAMQLDRKGIPVSVVVRVRPVLKGELSAGFGLRINSNKLTLEKHGTRCVDFACALVLARGGEKRRGGVLLRRRRGCDEAHGGWFRRGSLTWFC